MFLFYLTVSVYLISLHISFDFNFWHAIACTLPYGKGCIKNQNIVIIILLLIYFGLHNMRDYQLGYP